MASHEHGQRRRSAIGALVLSSVLLAVTGLAIDRKATADLLVEAEQGLLLLMDLRTSTLEHYLETTRSEVALWSGHGPPRERLLQFARAWGALGADASSALKRLYIENNPYPAGEKHKLIDAEDGSAYSRVHALLQSGMPVFLETHDYYDIFLIDPDGNILFAYFKEEDFATNLVTGRCRDTDMGYFFRAAREASDSNFLAFSDFEPYEPSDGAPASFLASPIRDDEGVLRGVLAIQISVGGINEIMQFTEGMGETGETYVVGEDLLMRSDSRFSRSSTILKTTVDTEAARRALAGESGADIISDYRGVEVVSAYGPLEFEGVRWAVLAEVDFAEVLAPARRLRRALLLTSLALLALVGAAGGLGVLEPMHMWRAADEVGG